MHRRRLLAGFAATVPLFAGCSMTGDNNDITSETSQSATTTKKSTTSSNSTPSATLATTMTETVQTTATGTANKTPTATYTPVSGTEHTGKRTGGPQTVIGTINIKLSNLTKYTNDVYSYSIKYPSKWQFTKDTPARVSFTSPTTTTSLRMIVVEDVSPKATLNQATADFLRGYNREIRQSNATTEALNRQSTTLTSGRPTILVDLRLNKTSGRNIRQKFGFSLANGILYVSAINLPEEANTPRLNNQMSRILKTLDISNKSAPA